MKVLFLNHHFRHDIDTLAFFNPGHDIREISPIYFFDRAKQVFPTRVMTEGGLEEYAKPQYEPYRKKWVGCLKRAIEEIYRLYPFDVFISPSYVFFYIYHLPEVLAELGIPFVVVQKETSRPPYFIDAHAKVVARCFSFKAACMTVCGPDQVKFSLASGVPKEKIFATGQPRFDFYRHPEMWKQRAALGLPVEKRLPTVLFLTYPLDCAIAPEAAYYTLDRWKTLRDETDAVFIDLVERTDVELLIKPHPQQPTADLEAMRTKVKQWAGEKWNRTVFFLAPEMDARSLLVQSDVLVGFQTTTLLEGLAAGKQVIYTFWTEEVLKLQGDLLPYHEYEPLMKVVKSPGELRSAVLAALKKVEDVGEMEQRLAAFTERLGPLDGNASQRTWQLISQEVAKSQQCLSSLQQERREYLLRHRYYYAFKEGWLSASRCLGWGVVFLLFSLGVPFLAKKRRGIGVRFSQQAKRMQECFQVIQHGAISSREIVGGRSEPFLFKLKMFFHSQG